jgi:hypothetical protein
MRFLGSRVYYVWYRIPKPIYYVFSRDAGDRVCKYGKQLFFPIFLFVV